MKLTRRVMLVPALSSFLSAPQAAKSAAATLGEGMIRRSFLLFVTTFVLVTGTSSAAWPPTLDVDWFELPDARPIACESRDESEVACAALSIKLKHFKRHIRKLLKLKSREIRIDHFPWTKSGELHRKFVIADSSVVELVVNESRQTFAVVNLPSCLGESRLEVFESDQLEREPEIFPESKLRPKYPPYARQLHMDGLAVIHGIIRSDGRITDLCSVIEIPAGYGFAESALEAISQWRWKPGRIEDEVADTLHSVTVYWNRD